MDSFERQGISGGHSLIAGVDEAGRGPLAGPVVAASVIFSIIPQNTEINDSKALSPAKRQKLVFEIYRSALSVGIGIVWPAEIDRINIHKASLKAMELAIGKLHKTPDLLLIDGPFKIDSKIDQVPIIGGDSRSVSIAAASIIAKTARDSIMEAYHRLYPEYNFMSNKGYATKEHLAAIREYGPVPIHRQSFSGVNSREAFLNGN